MKKLLAVLPLVAGAAWAGTTYVAGIQAEPAYIDLIAQLNEKSPVPIVAESYEQGYLQSTAVTRIMSSAEPDAKVLFKLKHEIDHSTVAVDEGGPRVGKSAIKTTLVLDEITDPDLLKLVSAFNGQDPIELFTSVGVNGASGSLLRVNAMALSEPEAEVTFGGADLQFTIDEQKSIKGDGVLQPLSFVDRINGGGMQSNEGSIEVDLSRHASGIYAGTQSYRLGSITFSRPSQGVQVGLNGLLIESDVSLDNGKADSRFRWMVDEIESPLPINSLAFDGGVAGLSVEAIAELQKIQRNQIDDPMDDAQIEALANKVISGFLQAGASLDWQLELFNDGGTATNQLLLQRVDQAADVTIHTTVGELVRSMSGDVSLDADAAAINEVPMVAGLLQVPPVTDFITFDGNRYSGQLTLADGVLNLNGNALPLELMLGDMLNLTLAELVQLSR